MRHLGGKGKCSVCDQITLKNSSPTKNLHKIEGFK